LSPIPRELVRIRRWDEHQAGYEQRLMQTSVWKRSRPTLSRALVIAGACVVAACSRGTAVSPEPAADLTAEKEALLKRDHEWHAAVAEKKDIAKITSFFASDGIMIGSGQATSAGREALTRAVEALVSGPDFHDEWKWDRVELSPDGKLAYLVGNTTITIANADGQPVTTRARLLNVWRKDPDGIWRCVVDMWVDEPSDSPAKAD
jgi:ketosteroid isomerase-like protein